MLFADRRSAQKLPFKQKSSSGGDFGRKSGPNNKKLEKIKLEVLLMIWFTWFLKLNSLLNVIASTKFFFTLLKSEIQILNMNPNQNDFYCFDLTNHRNLLTFGTHWWSSTNLPTINETIGTTDLPDNKKVISSLAKSNCLQLGWISRNFIILHNFCSFEPNFVIFVGKSQKRESTLTMIYVFFPRKWHF